MQKKRALFLISSIITLSHFLFFAPNTNQVFGQSTQRSQEEAHKVNYNTSLQSIKKNNFSTDLVTTYQVNEGGRTRVEHTITITNLKPLFTVSQYALQVNSPNIIDVSVTNKNETEINHQVIKTDSFSSIAIEFEDQVVGQGQQRIFTIAFTDPDAAVISGEILELAVPRIQEPSIYNQYTVHLITPIQYGTPSKVYPENHSTQLTENGFKTTFSSDPSQVSGRGIHTQSAHATQEHFNGVNAIFGSKQLFDITLQYHLENPHSSVRLAQIALPPDTKYQRVIYTQIDPKPNEIEKDRDGNWIATFRVPATSTLNVISQLKVQVKLEPDESIVIPPPTPAHTQATEHWQIHSNTVQEYAQQFRTPQEIYTFTSQALSYNYELATPGNIRLGAEAALKNPLKALCQEFTDVFISLARANNIPARRLIGYAHSENSTLRPLSFVEDVLHSWPEYYNSNLEQWIPVDPTWASTSGGINYFDQLDLNRIVFAINGESSQRPYPAGSYKLDSVESKDVEVSFGFEFNLPNSALSFNTHIPALSWIPFWKTPELHITNETGAAHYQQIVKVTPLESNISLWSLKHGNSIEHVDLDSILPFKTIKKPLIALDTERILPGSSTIQVTHTNAEQKNTTEITIKTYPYFWRWFFNPFVILGLVAGAISLTLITGSLLVLRQKGYRFIRWKSKKS